MTSIAKFASVLVIAIAPAMNTQMPVDAEQAAFNPATAESTVLVANESFAAEVPNKSNTTVTPVKTAISSDDMETKVKAYFKAVNAPILAEIAFCESTFRHYDKNGNVLRGKVDSRDVGVMQINLGYHEKTAQKLGLNLLDVEDNMAYALYLYKNQGVQPWKASSPCWS